MRKRIFGRKQLAILCIALHCSSILCIAGLAGATAAEEAYAAEPDEEDISGADGDDIAGSDIEDYEVTKEDIAEAERSVSEAAAASDSKETGYRSIRNPKLEVSYDPGTGYFTYRMPNGGYFMMNVPLGAICDEAVDLKTGEETWIDDLREDGIPILTEGKKYESMEEMLSDITEEQVIEATADSTGSYDFCIKSGTVEKTGITLCVSYGGFRITRNDIPLWINRVQAPYGYEIGQTGNSSGRLRVSGNSVELMSDGRYEISFKPVIQGLPEWTSRFVRDTTAPVLTFTPALTGQTMDRPVSFIPSEEGAVIRVYLNNKEVTLKNMTAYADGDYRVEISDAMGNGNVYFFSIDTEESPPYTVYLYIVLFLVAAAAAVIVTSHRKMRII